MLCRSTIDSLMLHLLRRVYGSILDEQNIVTVVQFIHTAIFCSDGSQPSDQEKSLREELAVRRALEFAQEEVKGVVMLFLSRCFTVSESSSCHHLCYECSIRRVGAEGSRGL
ncbi:hypothetical protein Y032_0315g2273 [Ancylostoma ceylanicum]|uniref:Uncharacterized protein n=1 Tax=Ancylostoma ceylanicum TaxID=53326 RepID=A0A016S1Z3_9BILA|nr:hypothetical protein Y032_0315g2273 [Ancylostoma ceylanicum]